MQIDPKREAQLKRLAGRIAEDLFGGHLEETHATRLVLAYKQADDTERFGGGWCKKAVRDVVLKHLLRAEDAKQRKDKTHGNKP